MILWLTLSCAATTVAETAPPAVEDCSDGEDNDGDGLRDCLDPDCDCVEEDCADGQDNDLDGASDCADPDCEALCVEDCADGIDNDQDGRTDCADRDCAGLPECIEDCFDGVDNDDDGLTDCADPDCTLACPEDCGDGQDNDADGFTDCLDSECDCVERCGDGLDNDQNGLVDCEDPECARFCSEQSCSDGVDEDSDGLLDCEDEDCWGRAPCPAVAVLALEEATSHGWSLQVRYNGSGSSVDYNSGSATLRNPMGALTLYSGSQAVDCDWSAAAWRVQTRSQGGDFQASVGFEDLRLGSSCAALTGIFSSSVHGSSGRPESWVWTMKGPYLYQSGSPFMSGYYASYGPFNRRRKSTPERSSVSTSFTFFDYVQGDPIVQELP